MRLLGCCWLGISIQLLKCFEWLLSHCYVVAWLWLLGHFNAIARCYWWLQVCYYVVAKVFLRFSCKHIAMQFLWGAGGC